MATARVIEPVDILEDRAFSLTACVPTVAPDQLSLVEFEERLDHRIIITISLAAHRDLEAVLGQARLILI